RSPRAAVGSRFPSRPRPFHGFVRRRSPGRGTIGAIPSCFTNRPPSSTFSEVGDSVLAVTDDAQLPAEIVLRDGRVQFAWKTTDTIPVAFYDSVAAAPAPLVPGVHDLRKRIP